ncbi:Lysophospholipase L1 [Alteribacillus persepolensis]|uniref:Lysophospholipase L1 n=2 Tax=Alteribacillus persepolensis TaxID=568899 RepID=A0A1G8AXN6_9BACI|nr:Lysophospholipase L1 [Alteribacillus persepolensis]
MTSAAGEDSSRPFSSVSQPLDHPKKHTPMDEYHAKEAVETASVSQSSMIENHVQTAVAEMVQEHRSEHIDTSVNMVAIGDSLTQGVGDATNNEGYIGILERIISSSSVPPVNFTIENYGKRGNRTDQLVQRMQEPEISTSIKNADVILITIGANDIMHIFRSNLQNLTYDVFADASADYENRLEEVFETIRAKNEDASVYLVGLFNPFHLYFDHIPELNQIVKDWNEIGNDITAEDEQAAFIPLDDVFQSADESYFAEDNFHPSSKGYVEIAKRVFEYIKPEVLPAEGEDTQ